MNFNGQAAQVLSLGFLALVLVGCTTSQYDIELEPTDKGMKRSLTFTKNVDDENGKPVYSKAELEKLDEIAAVYDVGKASDQDEVTRKFSGVFANRMPQDIGGSGEYRRWKSSLGHASVYVERFRGNDDLLSNLVTWNQRVDGGIDELIAWFESELKDESGYTELRAFLDGSFRRDIKNVGLHFWTLQFRSRKDDENEDAFTEQAMRAAQYLCERGYFAIEDVPTIVRAASEFDTTNNPRRPYELLQRLIASKMGVEKDQVVPSCLGFLASEKASSDSLNNYLRSTDEYKKLVADWEKSGRRKPKPDPTDVWANADGADEIFRFGDEVVSLELKSRTKPFATNGKWDDETETVKWSRSITVLESNGAIPMFAFALWSQPNTDVQVKHFGRVILDEYELGQYCVWYRGLSGGETKQWDSFLSTIKPSDDIRELVQAFRFDPPPGESSDDPNNKLAEHAQSLILRGLAGD